MIIHQFYVTIQPIQLAIDTVTNVITLLINIVFPLYVIFLLWRACMLYTLLP